MSIFSLKKLVKSFLAYPEFEFRSDRYVRHNARRLEHLSSLRLLVSGKTVLDVGAGIGDHASYYIDRGCKVTITDGRPENIKNLQKRYPAEEIFMLDMEKPEPVKGAPFDVVHVYGLLYHLGNPTEALSYLSGVCREVLFLETCVSYGEESAINLVSEHKELFSQSCSGVGCRPTRRWIFDELKKHFPYVYLPKTQPNHEEYPTDWSKKPEDSNVLTRSVFIASRVPLTNAMLSPELLIKQIRHE